MLSNRRFYDVFVLSYRKKFECAVKTKGNNTVIPILTQCNFSDKKMNSNVITRNQKMN